MTIDEEIVEYLEHFGVKGMHWGVRNQQTSTSTAPKKEPRFTKEQKRTAAVVAVMGGAIVASAIMQHRSNTRINDIRRSNINSSVNSMLKSTARIKYADIPHTTFRPPSMGNASRRASQQWLNRNKLKPQGRQTVSAAGDIKALRASIATSVKLANADLRARDNKNNIPFAMRSYIKEWD